MLFDNKTFAAALAETQARINTGRVDYEERTRQIRAKNAAMDEEFAKAQAEMDKFFENFDAIEVDQNGNNVNCSTQNAARLHQDAVQRQQNELADQSINQFFNF